MVTPQTAAVAPPPRIHRFNMSSAFMALLALFRQCRRRFCRRSERSGIPPSVRRHAIALRTAGFFGQFSGEFRTIRKTWAARFKGVEPPSDDSLTGMLVELANHVEARQSLEKDARLRAICGSGFFGLNTDIDCLLAANRLGLQIRPAFPGQAEPERSIRELLLEGQVHRVDAIKGKRCRKSYKS
jgi:hypothetical protein